jgi:hypothetical protein
VFNVDLPRSILTQQIHGSYHYFVMFLRLVMGVTVLNYIFWVEALSGLYTIISWTTRGEEIKTVQNWKVQKMKE